MIRLIEAPFPEIYEFCTRTPFGVRIASNLLSYGCGYPFAEFWYSHHNEKIDCCICKIDGIIVIEAAKETDFDELREFVAAIGYKAISCRTTVFERMYGFKPPPVYIMYRNTKKQSSEAYDDLNIAPRLNDVFELLVSIPEFTLTHEDFESWYLDMSHKMRRGNARAVMYGSIGTAHTSSETKNAAIISGVAVLPESRGNRIAVRLMKYILDELSADGKRAFLFCSKENIGFYRKLGFRRFRSEARAVKYSAIK